MSTGSVSLEKPLTADQEIALQRIGTALNEDMRNVYLGDLLQKVDEKLGKDGLSEDELTVVIKNVPTRYPGVSATHSRGGHLKLSVKLPDIQENVLRHVGKALVENRANVSLGDLIHDHLQQNRLTIDELTAVIKEVPHRFPGVSATLQMGDHMVMRVAMADLKDLNKLDKKSIADAIAENLDKVAVFGSTLPMIILESTNIQEARNHALRRVHH